MKFRSIIMIIGLLFVVCLKGYSETPKNDGVNFEIVMSVDQGYVTPVALIGNEIGTSSILYINTGKVTSPNFESLQVKPLNRHLNLRAHNLRTKNILKEVRKRYKTTERHIKIKPGKDYANVNFLLSIHLDNWKIKKEELPVC